MVYAKNESRNLVLTFITHVCLIYFLEGIILKGTSINKTLHLFIHILYKHILHKIYYSNSLIQIKIYATVCTRRWQ